MNASRARASIGAEPVAPPSKRRAAAADAVRVDRLARRAVWVAYGVILVLSLRAPLLRTGDAQQYVAMADALAHLRPPSLTPAEVASFKAWLASQPAMSYYPDAIHAIDQGNLRADGRQEFSHFWLYPLAAAPFVAGAEALGLHPGYGLFAANAFLLAGALLALGRAARPAVALLLLATPALWFVNKAQVEIFTFSLLTIAVCRAMRRDYLLAALAAALAATQNLPIAAAVPLFWAVGALRFGLNGGRLRPPWSRRLVVQGAIVGLTIAVCLLHPAYYLWRLGVVTPQELNNGFGVNLPDWEGLLAILVDPDIGLCWWAPLIPLFAGAGVVALSSRRIDAARRADLRWASLAAVLGAWFLLTFAQTTNVNSGGTMSMSRYGMWLLPLAIPFLAAAADAGAAVNLAMIGAALVALPLAALVFDPAQPERYVTPTPQSAWLDDWLPGRYRQIPEIFYERHRATDGGVRGSAATPGCQTILLTRDDRNEPCPLAPAEVADADALFADGWRAVWVTRAGGSGFGAAGVVGALRDAP
jgi:hypothetical protein